MPKKIVVACLSAAFLLPLGCQREPKRRPPRTAFVDAANTPVRISMEDLHMAGGVPPNWAFALPVGDAVAGRLTFQELGCPSCHVVEGEGFTSAPQLPGQIGPELTGMGSHHPEVYFVEAILNPDAVLVEGPGYIGADGRSVMPAYPDLTAEQLTNLVAYLKGLTDPGAHDHGQGGVFPGRIDLTKSNIPGEQEAAASAASPKAETRKASVFFVQTYSVRDGHLAGLERWFNTTALPVFRSFPDLLELETYIDRTRGPEALVTMFGFPDIHALHAFLGERPIGESIEKFDDFAEVIDRQIYETRPVYRVGSLSND